MDRPILVGFRRDFRLRDHSPLTAAAADGRPIIPFFIEDPKEDLGDTSRWWRDRSLKSLAQHFERIGSRLIFRRGGYLEQLANLITETNASALYLHRLYQDSEREKQIARLTQENNIEIQGFPGDYLMEPKRIKNSEGNPFRVFSPFWRYLQAQYRPPPLLPAPSRLKGPGSWPASLPLPLFDPHWGKGFIAFWRVGEEAAHEKLFHFRQDHLQLYKLERDRPDLAKTSRLSPHLAWGEISPHAIWRAMANHTGAEPFLRQIAWRDFQAHLYCHYPNLRWHSYNHKFAAFPYQKNEATLLAWQKGRTGYPLVDAGMQELWQSGWMHNRVRMVVASFLTKHLLIDWRDGEKWFWDTLLDADPAQNAGNWQWVAGSGADAAPYFRIFHPVKQSLSFDPDGIYIKKWLPELRGLSAKEIHEPWLYSGKKASYPDPIIDHKIARERALAAFASIKQT